MFLTSDVNCYHFPRSRIFPLFRIVSLHYLAALLIPKNFSNMSNHNSSLVNLSIPQEVTQPIVAFEKFRH